MQDPVNLVLLKLRFIEIHKCFSKLMWCQVNVVVVVVLAEVFEDRLIFVKLCSDGSNYQLKRLITPHQLFLLFILSLVHCWASVIALF